MMICDQALLKCKISINLNVFGTLTNDNIMKIVRYLTK